MATVFFLKKLTLAFIKPPGVFVLIAAAITGHMILRRRWRAALWAALAVLGLWLPAVAPVSDLLRRGLVTDIPGIAAPLDGEVIVVLGAGLKDRASDSFGAAGVLTESMALRVLTAVRLYRRLGVPIIVTGGAPLGERMSEADVATRYLVDLGVPREAVIVEGRSRDTGENARFVSDICRERGFGRLLLVSATHHLKRAVMAFESSGLVIRPVGDTGAEAVAGDYRWSDFLPVSYDDTAQYLHEYLGMMAYRLAG